jgi:4-hydroxyproline epimerase
VRPRHHRHRHHGDRERAGDAGDAGRLNLDAPAGRVVARYEQQGRFVESVRITNVASYLAATDIVVDVPGIGELAFDIAYGGNYYAILEPQKNFAA